MMNKKIFSIVCVATLLVGNGVFAQEQTPLIIRDDAVIVCRSKRCKLAPKVMTREFLYNKLGSLLKNNINRRVSFCEADATTHICSNDAISFEATVGATPATVYMPSALLVDAKAMRDDKTQKFVLDYDLKVGETYPVCQASLNQLQVISPDEISIETPGFECRFTGTGMSVINASYEVDYIDFDYGIIGAHYTIAVGQRSKGGKSGYTMLRFVNTANANNDVMDDCGCVCNETQNPPCQCDMPLPELETVIEEAVVVENATEDAPVMPQEQAIIAPAVEEKQSERGALAEDVSVSQNPETAEIPIIMEDQVPSQEMPAVSMPALEDVTFVTETQILKPGVPVVMEVEEDVRPGQVKAVSNWDK